MALTKVSYSMINGAPINILDLGAVMNDSGAKTANTAALNAAINAGGTILIPKGTLYINPITLDGTKGFVLLGEGRDKTTIKGDGNLFTITGLITAFISISSVTIENDSVNGILYYMNAGTASGGILFSDVLFGGCTHHFKADNLMVNQAFENCRFLNSSSFSRWYNGGSYVSVESNTYTNSCYGGILYAGDCFGNALTNCTIEQINTRAIYINPTYTDPTATAGQGFAFNNLYMEACAKDDEATIPYVSINGAAGVRLFNIAFNNCDFMHPGDSPALAYFVNINAGGGNVNNIIFNGGIEFGGTGGNFVNDTSAVVFSDFNFNSTQTYPSNALVSFNQRAVDVNSKVNYSVDVAGASNLVINVAVNTCCTILAKSTNSTGFQTFDQWFVARGAAGATPQIVHNVTNQKTDPTAPNTAMTMLANGDVYLNITGTSPTARLWVTGQTA
jgi:hypothetical protein